MTGTLRHRQALRHQLRAVVFNKTMTVGDDVRFDSLTLFGSHLLDPSSCCSNSSTPKRFTKTEAKGNAQDITSSEASGRSSCS